MPTIKGLKTELRPCPFCGSDNLGLSEIFRVHCYGCGAEGPARSRMESAAKQWNRRERVVKVEIDCGKTGL